MEKGRKKKKIWIWKKTGQKDTRFVELEPAISTWTCLQNLEPTMWRVYVCNGIVRPSRGGENQRSKVWILSYGKKDMEIGFGTKKDTKGGTKPKIPYLFELCQNSKNAFLAQHQKNAGFSCISIHVGETRQNSKMQNQVELSQDEALIVI